MTARPQRSAKPAPWVAPAALALALIAGSAAAATLNTSASVTIFSEPLTFTEATQLRFGSLASGEGGGTVTVEASDVDQRTTTGDVILLGGGNFGPATFEITGQADASYSIDLPDEIEIEHDNASKPTLTADTLTSYSMNLATLGTTGLLDGDGSDTFFVGATLHVPAGAAQGNYRGEIQLTVAYE